MRSTKHSLGFGANFPLNAFRPLSAVSADAITAGRTNSLFLVIGYYKASQPRRSYPRGEAQSIASSESYRS